MKMRLLGRGISNRYCDILFEAEKRFDRSKVLRAARDAAEEMDYYVKYFARASGGKQPYVYIKFANDFGGTNYAYITVSDTLLKNTKKLAITNHGFEKADLEVLTDLILQNLRVVQEHEPCPHQEQRSSQPEKQEHDFAQQAGNIPQLFQQSLGL